MIRTSPVKRPRRPAWTDLVEANVVPLDRARTERLLQHALRHEARRTRRSALRIPDDSDAA